MSSLPIFDIAGSALSAQSLRMNTLASNMANADSISGDPATVYRAREPVFSTFSVGADESLLGVQAKTMEMSTAEPIKRFEPGNPLADKQGYVYAPSIDPVAQMVNLISASRGYQAGVEMITTAKELAVATLAMGR